MNDGNFGRRNTDNVEYLRIVEKRLAEADDENAGLRCSVRDLLMEKANAEIKISTLKKTIERLRQVANLPEHEDQHEHE